MLVKILTDYQPANVIVAWDAGKKVFRHEEYEDYKAGRKPMPDNLSLQFEHFEELVNAFGFENLKKEGYEADDILATIAREAREESARPSSSPPTATPCSWLATASSSCRTARASPRSRSTTGRRSRRATASRRGRCPISSASRETARITSPASPASATRPRRPCWRTATTLEELLAHLDEIKGKRRELLDEYREQALMSKELATMNDEVPVERISLDAAAAGRDPDKLREFLTRFEFTSLIRRLEDSVMLEPPPAIHARSESRRSPWNSWSGAGEKGNGADAPAKAALALRRRPLAWSIDGGSLRLAVCPQETAKAEPAAIRVLVASAPLEEAAASTGRSCRAGHHRLPRLQILAGNRRPVAPACSHDTMVAAYLLKPTARTYNLDQLAAAADIRFECRSREPTRTMPRPGPGGGCRRIISPAISAGSWKLSA